jgi:hypothetical protein
MIKRLAVLVSVLFVLSTLLFIINQTAQVVALANTVNPAFGRTVLIVLAAIYTTLIAVPVALYLRMPRTLRPPADTGSEEYQDYLRLIRKRLACNPRLAGAASSLDETSGIEAAIRILDEHASGLIKKTASSVFVSTAISQNGRLDAIMVLSAQTRMIWQIAQIYNQRPDIREFLRLYANVGTTLFAANELDGLDLSEQVEPAIRAVAGSSVASLIPGLGAAATMIAHAIVEGTANAYLTLRVGVICQSYCSSLTPIGKKAVRRSATVAAAAMLGSIAGSSAAVVAKAIGAAAKRAGESTVESATAGLRTMGGRLNPFSSPPKDR